MLLGSSGLAYHAKTEITCRKSFIKLTSGHSNTKIPISVIRKKEKRNILDARLSWVKLFCTRIYFINQIWDDTDYTGKLFAWQFKKRDRVKDKNVLLL
jgi:hypothetical protein